MAKRRRSTKSRKSSMTVAKVRKIARQIVRGAKHTTKRRKRRTTKKRRR